MNVKKIIGKLEKKKNIYIYIYINVKTDKDEYVKLIIYLYIYIYIVKKIGINNNYVTNNAAMRWRNNEYIVINATLQLLVIINVTLQLLVIYR